jgi:hypothetical protein
MVSRDAVTSTDVTSQIMTELLARAPSPTNSVGISVSHAVKEMKEQSTGADNDGQNRQGCISATLPSSFQSSASSGTREAGDSFIVKYSRSPGSNDTSPQRSSHDAGPGVSVVVEGELDDTSAPPRNSPGPRVDAAASAMRTVSPPRGRAATQQQQSPPAASPAFATFQQPQQPAAAAAAAAASDSAVADFIFAGQATELAQDEALGRMRLGLQEGREREHAVAVFTEMRDIAAHTTGLFLDEKTPAKNSTGFAAPTSFAGMPYRTPTPGRARAPLTEEPASPPSPAERLDLQHYDDSDATPDASPTETSFITSSHAAPAGPAGFMARAQLVDLFHEGACANAEGEGIGLRAILMESHRQALDIRALEKEISMQLSSAASAGTHTHPNQQHGYGSSERLHEEDEGFVPVAVAGPGKRQQLRPPIHMDRSSSGRPQSPPAAHPRGQSPVDSTKQRFNVSTTLIPTPYVGATAPATRSRSGHGPFTASMLELHADRRMSGASIGDLLERMKQDSSFRSRSPAHLPGAAPAGVSASAGASVASRVQRITSAVSRVDNRLRRKY